MWRWYCKACEVRGVKPLSTASAALNKADEHRLRTFHPTGLLQTKRGKVIRREGSGCQTIRRRANGK